MARSKGKKRGAPSASSSTVHLRQPNVVWKRVQEYVKAENAERHRRGLPPDSVSRLVTRAVVAWIEKHPQGEVAPCTAV